MTEIVEGEPNFFVLAMGLGGILALIEIMFTSILSGYVVPILPFFILWFINSAIIFFVLWLMFKLSESKQKKLVKVEVVDDHFKIKEDG